MLGTGASTSTHKVWPALGLQYDLLFQAEDGIRDLTVTGVQTCALPICKDGLLKKLLLIQRTRRVRGEGVGALVESAVSAAASSEGRPCERQRRNRCRIVPG